MSINTNTKDKDTTVKDEHICGEKCQIYSRCCGYYRPVENWNIGKQQEFKERLLFEVQPKNKAGAK
ncbi:MAG: hypothetical protein IJG38_05030 [Thermoguttaceae bacterium]|nr:hypothetical protein [Thermoguttaceae bacterium]